MKFRTLLAAAALFAGTASLAGAQEDIIHLRQALMNSNQEATKVIVAMLRNQIPFDAAIVSAALTTISHETEVFPTFFPPGTETGAETEAKPEIWANMADFQAQAAKMTTDAAAAAAAAGGDRQAFLAAFKTVSDNCNACHEKYRVEKD